MVRVVILGTGTSVGKTWVATTLARSTAPTCLALKPIESGLSEPRHSDAAKLFQASPLGPGRPLHAFIEPVTPWLAAEESGVVIQLEAVKQWVEEQEAPYTTLQDFYSIIETAGGAFSPLSQSATNLDLARALEPSYWVLVASNALGVLHQVTATLLAMRHLARVPDLVLLCETAVADASTPHNARLLRQLHPQTEFLELGRDDQAPLEQLAQRLRLVAKPC